ncbi:YceI family protein [Aquimarina pacifica]|uniref:YceI family protein n=1 Tax=Aquimarina pacifica TaxID=1296415 RepID=UPI00047182D3|nr:YceI family protein [Aquimarina pacifica]
MKFKLTSAIVVTCLVLTSISCKNEKKNESEVTISENTVETPVVSLQYAVDKTSSIIEWTGKKPIGQHTGTIQVIDGAINTKEGKIQNGTFTIDMNSIVVTDLEGDKKAGLEGHLKGEGEGKEDHFFNVAKYPSATFEMTHITEKEGKTFAEGNLTLKGVKKNIAFPVSVTTSENNISLNSDVFTIDRTQWGVNYKSKSVVENLGDKFINDDIELKISVKATKI